MINSIRQFSFRGRMGNRGAVGFAVAFIVLPLLGIVGAGLTTGGAAVGLLAGSLALLLLGFTVGLFLLE